MDAFEPAPVTCFHHFMRSQTQQVQASHKRGNQEALVVSFLWFVFVAVKKHKFLHEGNFTNDCIDRCRCFSPDIRHANWAAPVRRRSRLQVVVLHNYVDSLCERQTPGTEKVSPFRKYHSPLWENQHVRQHWHDSHRRDSFNHPNMTWRNSFYISCPAVSLLLSDTSRDLLATSIATFMCY